MKTKVFPREEIRPNRGKHRLAVWAHCCYCNEPLNTAEEYRVRIEPVGGSLGFYYSHVECSTKGGSA